MSRVACDFVEPWADLGLAVELGHQVALDISVDIDTVVGVQGADFAAVQR